MSYPRGARCLRTNAKSEGICWSSQIRLFTGVDVESNRSWGIKLVELLIQVDDIRLSLKSSICISQ